MLDEKLDGRVDERIANRVIVVEHERTRCRCAIGTVEVLTGSGGKVVDQRCREHLRGGQLRQREQALHAQANVRIQLLQRGDQIAKEANRVIVPIVQCKPRARLTRAREGLCDQRGLAVTGRRRDKRESSLRA